MSELHKPGIAILAFGNGSTAEAFIRATQDGRVDASQRILDLGLAESAHTVHLVAPGIDTGPILCSTPVPVESGDTAEDLFNRVQLVEKAVLPLAIDKFLKEQAANRGNS